MTFRGSNENGKLGLSENTDEMVAEPTELLCFNEAGLLGMKVIIIKKNYNFRFQICHVVRVTLLLY